MSILQVKNLTHTYDGNIPFVNDAICDINFSVNAGEIVGIIGHTGSGKSTLVSHLNGLLKPTNGEVLIEQKDIWEKPKEIRKIRSKVGLVFQYPEYQLFEETIYNDIAFGPKNIGIKGEALDNRVKEICDLIGIKSDYFDKSPFELSGGEKRRVAIAGVMAMKPQIIIFDEPTAGLDPKGRQDVMEIIKNYRKATGATVIIISHSMEDIAFLTEKLLVLSNGKLVMFDKTENVFKKGNELRKIGLNVPIVTRIFSEISKMGIDVPQDVFTIERAVEVLKNIKAGNKDA